jgi:curved DNA binding protein
VLFRRSEESDEEFVDVSCPEVLAKYRLAAEIANRTLKGVIEMCQPGAKLVDLCEFGDSAIVEECAKVHNKGKAKVEAKDKGVAFPTCVSVNEVSGHNSVASADESVLAAGDLVKIDLAAHIDGWIAAVAHTVVVSEDPAAKIEEGPKRNVVLACAVAAEAVLANLKPGATNNSITPLFQRAADAFGVNVVEGVLSHQMKRFVIDGNKVIIGKVVPGEQAVEEEEFELNDVFSIDILMSTGEGKPVEKDEKKQMVFKRAVDQNYNLKMKVSREIFSRITTEHPTLPFSLRQYDDARARLGMKECLEHELFTTYPVLEEKEGEFVAHMKFTVTMTEEGVQRITGGFGDCNCLIEGPVCEDEELDGFFQAALAKIAKKNAKKNKKKK